MTDLQRFIEQNKGKVYGDEYRYGNVILNTRYCRATEPHAIEIALVLPWWYFSDCLDNRKISNNAEFFNWLEESFFPLAENRLKEAYKLKENQ